MNLTFGIAEPLHETPSGGGGGGSSSPLMPSEGSGGASSASAGTASQSSQEGLYDANAPQHDPVPWDQHEALRTRAEKTAWAEQHDQQQVTTATQILNWLKTDPAGAHAYITRELTERGVLQRPQPGPQQVEPHTDPRTGEPLADLVVQETGLKVYSAAQMQKHAQWNYARMQQLVTPIQQREQQRETYAQANAQAQDLIRQAESWPGFSENVKEIYAVLQRDGRATLHSAYIQVVPQKLAMRARQDLANETRVRGNAGTHNPATSGASRAADLSKVPTKDLLRAAMQEKRRA